MRAAVCETLGDATLPYGKGCLTLHTAAPDPVLKSGHLKMQASYVDAVYLWTCRRALEVDDQGFSNPFESSLCRHDTTWAIHGLTSLIQQNQKHVNARCCASCLQVMFIQANVRLTSPVLACLMCM